MKTAKEFIESDHFNLKLDCPDYLNDIAEAMEDFANAKAKAVLEEAQNKLKEAGYTNAHEIIESLIPKEQ